MNFTKLSVFGLVFFFMTACSPGQLQNVVKDVIKALEIGITKGASQLSAFNGYFESPYKILLPPEARQITDKLAKIPVC